MELLLSLPKDTVLTVGKHDNLFASHTYSNNNVISTSGYIEIVSSICFVVCLLVMCFVLY